MKTIYYDSYVIFEVLSLEDSKKRSLIKKINDNNIRVIITEISIKEMSGSDDTNYFSKYKSFFKRINNCKFCDMYKLWQLELNSVITCKDFSFEDSLIDISNMKDLDNIDSLKSKLKCYNDNLLKDLNVRFELNKNIENEFFSKNIDISTCSDKNKLFDVVKDHYSFLEIMTILEINKETFKSEYIKKVIKFIRSGNYKKSYLLTKYFENIFYNENKDKKQLPNDYHDLEQIRVLPYVDLQYLDKKFMNYFIKNFDCKNWCKFGKSSDKNIKRHKEYNFTITKWDTKDYQSLLDDIDALMEL